MREFIKDTSLKTNTTRGGRGARHPKTTLPHHPPGAPAAIGLLGGRPQAPARFVLPRVPYFFHPIFQPNTRSRRARSTLFFYESRDWVKSKTKPRAVQLTVSRSRKITGCFWVRVQRRLRLKAVWCGLALLLAVRTLGAVGRIASGTGPWAALGP